MKTRQQPDYGKSLSKFEARDWIVQSYRRLSGNKKIPSDRRLWSLCHSPEEVHQYVDSALIDPHQFCGINRDVEGDLIPALKTELPTSEFFKGEWRTVIQEMDSIPACIYFDSTQEIENLQLLEDIACTMRLCPEETLLIVNVIVKNSQRKNVLLSDTKLGNFLVKRFDPGYLKTWKLTEPSFEYKTRKTGMRTFLFWRTA